MTGESRDLLELAARISDGDQVDWDRVLDRTADDGDRELVRDLKIVDGVAQVHRGPGEAWGSKRLLEKLGGGRSGEVYRAWDPELEREVAVKLLHRDATETERDRAAALKEGRLLAKVGHPNVVTVFAAEEHDGRVGFVMELVRGRALASQVREEGVRSPGEAALIGVDLCRALAAVHAAGVVHRDVKADNVIRSDRGEIMLADFGAGCRAAESGFEITSGTPLYMAPEVLAGGPPTARSDLYSLGVLLFHLVTGSYPVQTWSLEELQDKHRRGEVTRLRDLRPDLPQAFIAVVERLTDADPGGRFGSAGEAEAALAESAHLGRQRRPGPRRWLLVAVFALVASALVAWWALVPRGFFVDAGLVRVHPDGVREPLAEGADLSLGDRIALRLRSDRPLYVYVVNTDEQGRAYALFPLPGLDLQNPLAPDVEHLLPGSVDGRPRFWGVDTPGGREHLLILASPERQAEFESEMAALALPKFHADPVELDEDADARLARGLGTLLELPQPATSSSTGRLLDLARSLGDRATLVRGVWFRHVRLSSPEP